MPSSPTNLRSYVVLAYHAEAAYDKKNRPAVVLQDFGDTLIVAFGQGDPPSDAIVVEKIPGGTNTPFDKLTQFALQDVHAIPRSRVIRNLGKCPNKRFLTIEAGTEERRRQLASQVLAEREAEDLQLRQRLLALDGGASPNDSCFEQLADRLKLPRANILKFVRASAPLPSKDRAALLLFLESLRESHGAVSNAGERQHS